MPQLAHFLRSHSNCSSLLKYFSIKYFYDDHRHCLTWLGRGSPGSQTQWEDTRRGCHCHAPGMMMWEADLCSRGWCLSWSLAQIRSRVVSCLPCVGTWDLANNFDKTWSTIFLRNTHLKEFWFLCWRSVIEHLAQFVVTLTRREEWRPRSETWQIFSSVAESNNILYHSLIWAASLVWRIAALL